jgi:hypothetical protein
MHNVLINRYVSTQTVNTIQEQNVTQVELVDIRQQISTAVNETLVVKLSAPGMFVSGQDNVF